MPTWNNRKQKADQMQVYLDQWFDVLKASVPYYKNMDLKAVKKNFLDDDFDPILKQAIVTYRKLDKYVNKFEELLNDNS